MQNVIIGMIAGAVLAIIGVICDTNARITTLEHAIDAAIAAQVRDIEPIGGE